MNKIIIFILVFASMSLQSQAQTISDIDGNIYKTVSIGNQIWMAENLKTTHFNNGDSIHNETTGVWIQLTSPAYCNFKNDTSNGNIYGHLYNWYAATDKHNVCPSNWHVPSNSEWASLVTYLGGTFVAGGEMKDTDKIYWKSANYGATNESGFSGLPAGAHFGEQEYSDMGYAGFWWSSNAFDAITAYYRYISNESKSLYISNNLKSVGFSVRCLWDSSYTQIDKIDLSEQIKIFPNPTRNNITIDLGENQNSTFSIIDISGKIVIKDILKNNINDINLNSLSRGVYVINISNNNAVLQHKIIKY